MVRTKNLLINNNSTEVYGRAIARIELELGLPPNKAHRAIAEFAAAHGVFLDDVAKAVLGARTIKRGLGRALKQVVFERKPLVRS